ncbi:MAG: peptidoglycan-binding protein, partial [Acidimicrobiia bacterium]|nr:peptidoglycan-binding protein [Acidimicrobiia bacterium]
MQADRSHPRGDGDRVRGQAAHRQGRRRRVPRRGPALRDHEHSDPGRLSGRRGQKAHDRRQGQGPAGPGAGGIPVARRLEPLLRQGSSGEAVRDLQVRLGAAGHDIGADRAGLYGAGTDEAVRAFQERRGLRVDGICGPQTWASLVEAGYHLGDRLLYHTSPPLRGDDVAELQRRLGALGFDAGRVDAIFGEDTQRAVLEFQRNAGLTADGVCGPATRAVLVRVKARSEDPIPVADIREREALRQSPRTLQGRTVVVGQTGGLDALADAVVRALGDTGAQAIPLHHLDGSAQAHQANGVGADVFVGLASAATGCSTAFYAAHGFESRGG